MKWVCALSLAITGGCLSSVLVASEDLIPTAEAQVNHLPDGLSLVGLDGDTWRVYIASRGNLDVVPNIEHPRGIAYHHSTRLLAYIAPDNQLRELDLQSGQIVDVVGDTIDSRHTQPHYSADGRWLFAVEMPEGKSRRTVIVGLDREMSQRHEFVKKRTAQFEPFLHGERYLYYTTALCVDDCGRMIWELWRRDMFTAKQEQLTLTNAVATQPHVSNDGWLYFSADSDSGRFHIWRMKPEVGAKPEQLTFGEVRDSEPTTDASGILYFIRKTRDGARLMMRDASGEILRVALGSGFDDLRNLEIGR